MGETLESQFGSEWRLVNRLAFHAELTGSWLPAAADVHARLSRPGTRIADVGCGHGWYGWSISHCLPAAMAEQLSAALGTVLREDAVRALAATAGFGRTEVVEVDAGFFRVYRLEG